MKNFIEKIGIALCGVAIMVSCANAQKQQVADKTVGTDDVEVIQLFKNITKSYFCAGDTTFGADQKIYDQESVKVQWLSKFGDKDIKILQDSLIAQIGGKPLTNIDSTMLGMVDAPIYETDGKFEIVDSVPSGDNIRLMTNETSALIATLTERLVVYKISNSSYQGGAHPSYSDDFLNYSILDNTVLNFKNTFKQGSDDAVFNLVKEQLMKQNGAKNIDELAEKGGIFIDSIFLSHNIYFTPDAIVFYYNPYDIGPWVIGAVSVSIDSYLLTDYLTPAAAAIFAYPR